MTYQDKLKDPRWQKKRLEILARDKWECKKCGDEKTTLHVHHLEYNNNPWETDSKDLVTLCKHCHKIIEGFPDINYNDFKINKFVSKDGFKMIIYLHDSLLTIDLLDSDDQFYDGISLSDLATEYVIKFIKNNG